MKNASENLSQKSKHSNNFIDRTGKVYDRLTVIRFHSTSKDYRSLWLCRCECGMKVIVNGHDIGKHTKSCGCLNDELRAARNFVHGFAFRGKQCAEYSVWCAMKARCYNPKNKCYHIYGGNGIRVCKRWLDSFEKFLKDMGKRPSPKHLIDRIKNNKNYEPKNCKWSTPLESANNTSRNHLLKFNGKSQSISMWSRELGINEQTLVSRINESKWSIERALTTPVQ